MTTPPNVNVATVALRQEAQIWDSEATKLRELAAMVDRLRLSGLEAGVFFMMLDAYAKVVDVVTGRCVEGGQRADEIAATLRQVADTYDAEDQAGEHRLRNLW